MHRALPPGFDEFAQALKETNTAKTWLTNPAVIKAMAIKDADTCTMLTIGHNFCWSNGEMHDQFISAILN
jgi:hypothetical protein